MNKTNYFIQKDLEAYLLYIGSVRNLSQNTVSSYKRDLEKLILYLKSLNIGSYSEATESACSSWIGNLFASDNNPKRCSELLFKDKLLKFSINPGCAKISLVSILPFILSKS